jgi:hypothetical protein
MGHSKIEYQGAGRGQAVILFVGFLQNYVVPYLRVMILLQQKKKRREPGKKCHARSQSYVFFYILLFFSSPGPEDGQARSSASHFFLLTTIFISVSILGKEDIKSRKWDQEFL